MGRGVEEADPIATAAVVPLPEEVRMIDHASDLLDPSWASETPMAPPDPDPPRWPHRAAPSAADAWQPDSRWVTASGYVEACSWRLRPGSR